MELLNDASMATDPQDKIDALKKVQERLIHTDPDLLDNFLEEVLGFQKDRSQEVKKLVVGFVEESCKKDPDLFPKVITNLRLMMSPDEPVAVRKRVIQAMTHLYKVCLSWLSKAKTITDNMEAVWNVVGEIKANIIYLLDSDNDGVRTHAIKFMEMLVLAQTHGEEKKGFSLDEVPLTLKIARPRKLEEEALMVFEELIKYHGSPHISSANLMTCMGSLANVAKQRPSKFMSKVITALEMLHANLPPTLAKSQVSSVRKHLKNQLLSILKHPLASEHFFTNVTTLLTDLGASREEVMKAMPKFDEAMLKRKAKKAEKPAAEPVAKKQKLDDSDSDDEEEEEEEEEICQSAVDITEKFVSERMEASLVTELVMRSMPMLPQEIPPHFYNSYTPIAAAGTDGQVKHVSRLLAAQMTAVNLGPGVQQVREMDLKKKKTIDAEEEPIVKSKSKIAVIGGEEIKDMVQKVQLVPSGLASKKPSSRSRTLKLNEITKALLPEQRNGFVLKAMQRILGPGELAAKSGGIPDIRSKMIVTLAARFSSCTTSIRPALLSYIFQDVHKRIDLAFSWLYEEYCYYQGFHKASSLQGPPDDSGYNNIFCHLIHGVVEKTDGKDREVLLRRLYLESPIITEDAIDHLKRIVCTAGSALTVVNLMKDLVLKRPTKKLNFLNFLLEFCSHDIPEVRQTANQTVLQLHKDGDFRDIIEDYSVMYLRFLMTPVPPEMLFTEDRGRSVVQTVWTEDMARICLYLFLSLLPHNQKLLFILAEVYADSKTVVVDTTSGRRMGVKHTILRELDIPVAQISMDSLDLLELVEKCPLGSETLITRIIHILTDKSVPSAQLVDKVRILYRERVPDVRFLIPVLNGLQKQEVVQSLPKLIQLSPGVVKEVFHRLMVAGQNKKGPLSPADLLIALHNLEVDDMKLVISATNLCFKEKSVYTQEVLAIVLQQLMEQPNIPILLMRTVIQSLTNYPRMVGFITNILQRLIVKQVWKQKVVWDGFIKCCERTIPQSYAVMLQLPVQQLWDFLDAAPHLREPLLEHVQSFNEAQRAHITARVMKVLYNVKDEDEIKQEVEEDDEEKPPGE